MGILVRRLIPEDVARSLNCDLLGLRLENKMQNITTTIQILLARFNGQVLIPFAPASESVGISAQTARNRLSNGTFPMPTRLVESRRFIHISDLANFVDSLSTSKPAVIEPTQARRGRPPKLGRLKAQGGA